MSATKERIFAIADALDAQGQNPTLALVRRQLGGGSYTTISEAMGAWRAQKRIKEGPPLREPPPHPITDRLGELGSEIWSLACELANGRFATEREALEAIRIELEAGKTEAAELADQASAELEALQGRFATLETAEATARGEANDLREKLAGLTERAAVAETRAIEIEKRADDLNAELARVNGQNASLVKALADTDDAHKKP